MQLDDQQVPWYEAPDDLDTEWLTYDIAKDFSPDQARDDHGRWTSGGGGAGGGGHAGGYSAWTRSFDSREHDKQIEQHRLAEESHRAAGAKIKDQIAGLRDRAKTATPRQQATLQRKTDHLKQQYEQHRAAATAARDQRRQVQQDLERARGEHTAGRLATAGARREYEGDRSEHEAAGGMAIGHTRIAEGDEEHAVTPTAEQPHLAETPDSIMRIGTGYEAIRADPETEAAAAAAAAREEAGRAQVRSELSGSSYRTASDRQVVSYGSTGPKTQEEWNAHDQRQREARDAGNAQMRERQAAAEAAKPAPEPKPEPLPEARARTGLFGRIRSLFGRKQGSLHPIWLNRPDLEDGATVWGMAPSRYKLKLTKLDFLSLVDTPAQETAAIRLIKRKDGSGSIDIPAEFQARILKVSDGDDPLIYCWAFTCTDENGQPYHDLQGDAVTEFIKAAEQFMRAGGAVDEMHDGKPKSHVAFAFPMDPDIAKAMFGAAGAAIKTAGLMVAIRPTTEQLAQARSGEFNGVSIAGSGTRELVKTAPACPSCGKYGKADDTKCASCGNAMKRAAAQAAKSVLATATRDDLPDSAFLYIEPGGKKDADGKTTPRELRMFPYRNSSGAIDILHLRAACSDIPKSSLADSLKTSLQAKAEKLLGKQHGTSKRIRKQAVLTSAVDGHAHSLDLDDPADEWRDQLSTSYQTAAGATQSHCHAWTYDPATGAITIAEDSGHTHPVDAVVPDDVRAQAALQEDGERCRSCAVLCEEGCKFCPNCGAAMGPSDGVPVATTDEDSGSGAAVVIVAARAPDGKSPLATAGRTVKGKTKEPSPMPDDNARIRELEASNARLEKMSTLTDAQRAHFAKLSGSDAQQFLNLSPPARDAQLADIAKADEVVYTSPVSGKAYRKSASPEILELVMQADAATMAQRAADVRAETAEFSKRGDATLGNFAKGVKGELRGRLLKAINKEFTDATEHEEVVKALKAADHALKELTVAKGYNPHKDPGDEATPQAKLDQLAAEYAKANNVPIHKAAAAVLETQAGAALYAQIPTARA